MCLYPANNSSLVQVNLQIAPKHHAGRFRTFRSCFAPTGFAAFLLVGFLPGIVSAEETADSEQTEISVWPIIAKPSPSAPNILLIMTDDVGVGATSTFSGPVSTPTNRR